MSDTITGSTRATQTDADRALEAILPACAMFQERLKTDLLARIFSGHITLKVEFDRGRVTQVVMTSAEGCNPMKPE